MSSHADQSGITAAQPAQPGMTAGTLAKRLEGALEGDGARVIHGVDTLEDAGPHSLSWVGEAKFLKQAAESNAGVILMPLEGDAPSGKTVIRVPDPDLAVCDALTLLSPPLPKPALGVHPSATIEKGALVEGAAIGVNVYVGAGACIGSGTQLHAGVFVGEGTKIGRDCVLWPHVVVRERVTVGERVIIHPSATIGADGFGYLQRDGKHVKIPQTGTVHIEDDVEIGANSTIDRARSGVTRVGRGTKIDNLVTIAHNCQVGEHCMIVAQSGMGGSTKLGDHVVLGGRVGIIDHRTIGAGVQIAAGSIVFNDIAAGTIVRGIPAVANQRFLREQVALGKLPELLKHIRALEKRIEDIESQ